ncbi:U3 snoRNP-associated protein Utp6 [Schizosaccharomyces pombe]|uniref:U3 small nucleolar RNA-associated protein 6 n=1 Tax=Schizosaccharomyces pombe (strain 972 / ATCC 24843) TaxID=284812 RepID=UTP6_SCHPO|nr:putative U3 snoRNP-associated protein Utp6 [Schizosaccharomyces pombe]O60188.1 RecName: Full=U3 small nucleolar RNA-associated protein 6; Short=U3 snoRNA-associated protein 6 [Schizosaccharomyces pombe 972h-]CAA19317.1 U3 snoRNP-associated protein Utp6 (predicted) [Schizosaccharomyces pombe]|eukprot:NP_596813.1 putative U3 snoRNP-associated protein Utp6 [Schizosaccharomyces pombe]
MAEKVQYYMEQSVPELEDLLEKNIFNRDEINNIIKTRRVFEEKLARRQVKLNDFLSYIQYEINLETLRAKRHKRLNITGKITISDYAGPRKVLFLFLRATNKFFGDVTLWLDYIHYAQKIKAVNIVGKICVAALQKHPNNAELWVVACDHEFSINANVSAARALMNRALRLNQENPVIWAAYFRLELSYMTKLFARSQILTGNISSKTENITNGVSEDTIGSLSSDTIQLPMVSMEEFLGSSSSEVRKNDSDLNISDDIGNISSKEQQTQKFANVLLQIILNSRKNLSLQNYVGFFVSVLDALFECFDVPVVQYMYQENIIGICNEHFEHFKNESGEIYGVLLHRWCFLEIFIKLRGAYPSNDSGISGKGIFGLKKNDPRITSMVLTDPGFVDDLQAIVEKYQSISSDFQIPFKTKKIFYSFFVKTLHAISSSSAAESSIALALHMLVINAFQSMEKLKILTFDDSLQEIYKEAQIQSGTFMSNATLS